MTTITIWEQPELGVHDVHESFVPRDWSQRISECIAVHKNLSS